MHGEVLQFHKNLEAIYCEIDLTLSKSSSCRKQDGGKPSDKTSVSKTQSLITRENSKCFSSSIIPDLASTVT